jgi:hypothetical protein
MDDHLLDIYAKALKEDLTPADKQQLRQLVNRFPLHAW